jgi:hypothetical protein
MVYFGEEHTSFTKIFKMNRIGAWSTYILFLPAAVAGVLEGHGGLLHVA